MNQIESVLALTKIEHDALSGFRNLFQRAPQLIAGVVDRRTEHVAGYVLAVHAHQHRLVRAHVTHHHRQMHVAIDRILESDRAKRSIDRGQIGFDGALHQDFLADSIVNQIGDADDLQTVYDWQSRAVAAGAPSFRLRS